jgi:hypothetical protein
VPSDDSGLTPSGRRKWIRSNAMYLRFDQQYEVEPSGCWIWKRFLSEGYGVVKVGHRAIRAHRFSYERANGPIPKGAVIRHKCDRTNCVNPDHLEIGTQADNVRDAVERGRAKGAPGVRNAKAKLTPDQIIEIRRRSEAGETRVTLAAAFGVAPTMISNIARGVNWKHVHEEAHAVIG